MRIVFFTQDDPFYVKVFFDEFFRIYKSLDEIKAIVISRPMGKKKLTQLASQMYALFGPYHFLRISFKFTYIRIMGKKKFGKYPPGLLPPTYTLKQTANAFGVPVIERSDLNSQNFRNEIAKCQPDLFVSVASPVIFKEKLIEIPKLDCINIHNAPLPKYKGMLPNFWQLYHGEIKAGMTIHKMDSGIDTGDIVAQELIDIQDDDTLDTLIKRTKRLSAKLAARTIEAYRRGEIKYSAMSGTGSYFSFPERKDVLKFKQLGRRIF